VEPREGPVSPTTPPIPAPGLPGVRSNLGQRSPAGPAPRRTFPPRSRSPERPTEPSNANFASPRRSPDPSRSRWARPRIGLDAPLEDFARRESPGTLRTALSPPPIAFQGVPAPPGRGRVAQRRVQPRNIRYLGAISPLLALGVGASLGAGSSLGAFAALVALFPAPSSGVTPPRSRRERRLRPTGARRRNNTRRRSRGISLQGRRAGVDDRASTHRRAP
jgi:hypothetical protein